MDAFGITIIALVILSIITPFILIPLFNSWVITGILLLIFGITIIILSGFWFSNQKRSGLSVTLPIVGFVLGALILIIGFILLFVRFFTITPEVLSAQKKPAFTFDECTKAIRNSEPGSFTARECEKAYPKELAHYIDCKAQHEASIETGENTPELANDIQYIDSCQRKCNKEYILDKNFPIDECLEDCVDNTNCLKYRDLRPYLYPSAPVSGTKIKIYP